jgi:uncharacterized membrane protein YfcA
MVGALGWSGCPIFGLPLRLFREKSFAGVGLFCFVAGMIVGTTISSRVRARLRTRGMIIFFGAMIVLIIVMYLLYISSVDRVEPPQYLLSARQFWEFFLFGGINFCWGLLAEVAASTTTLLGKPDHE